MIIITSFSNIYWTWDSYSHGCHIVWHGNIMAGIHYVIEYKIPHLAIYKTALYILISSQAMAEHGSHIHMVVTLFAMAVSQ